VAAVGFITFLALDAKGGVMEDGWSFMSLGMPHY
jgi:hypothetical protein